MVAASIPKNKSIAETQERMAHAPNQQISHRLKAQVRTLYLVEGHSPKTIEGLGVGLTTQQISNLANREGWSAQRRQACSKVEQTSVARVDAAVQAVAEAIAVESEELCFRALDVTRAGLLEGGLTGAKQAQAASSTLKNLHSVAQAIRKPEASASSDTPASFNLFFVSPTVAPIAQQVTEVEAKSVQ